MFRRFLPLLIVIGVVFVALFPSSAVMQSRPDEPQGELRIFDPLAPATVAQSDGPTEVTTFDVTASASLDNRSTAQQGEAPAAASNMRISQLYTRGGETGATYSQDFVEIFNAGNTTVDIQNWRIVVVTFEGTTQQSIGVVYPSSFSVTPGMHLLVRFNGNGSNGQALNSLLPLVTDISLGSTSGQIFLLSPTQSVPGTGTCPTSVGPNGAVSDMLGYGSSTCAEGSPVAAPPSNKSQLRINGGCTDTDNNLSDFAVADPNPRNFQAGVTPCGGAQPTPTPTPSPTPSPSPGSGSQFSFAQTQFEVFEGPAKITITVNRSGNTSGAGTVNFATSNGSATAPGDYTATSGTLSFAAGVTQQTFQIPIIDDTTIESDETVNLTLSSPSGGTLGSPSSATLIIHDNDSTAPTNPKIYISQIYPGGGEPGATYQKDYIELFNADNTTINIQGWSLVITNLDSSGKANTIGAAISSSIPLQPGQHVLLTMPGTGSNGQPLPAEFSTDAISLASSGGQVFLIPKDKFPSVFTCPSVMPDPRGIIENVVGYGQAACFAGSVAPIPPPNKALVRIGGGCTLTFGNADDFVIADPNPHRFSSPLSPPCGAQPTSAIGFAAAQSNVAEGAGKATITVTRTGDLTAAASVDYLTTDGTASERNDYNRTAGTLRFGVGESQKTIDVLITDDILQEPTETVSLALSDASGNGTLGSTNTATLFIVDNDGSSSTNNPVDISSFYVDQHYHDFLNRVPDSSGLQFWINNIESCTFVNTCRDTKRVDTSAAFFLSIEFQKTGFEVYRAYKAVFPDSAQRPRGMVRYREFMRDTQAISRGVIVGNAGYEALLEANTRAFFQSMAANPEFLAVFPGSMDPSDYIDTLNAHTGNILSATERNNLLAGMLALTETRATVLRKVAENPAFTNAEFNRAFVLMQYYGYLRRNVDDLPDKDFTGFDFWLGKLNQFNGDFKAAEMVKAFITSDEYRKRFGPVTGAPPGP